MPGRDLAIEVRAVGSPDEDGDDLPSVHGGFNDLAGAGDFVGEALERMEPGAGRMLVGDGGFVRLTGGRSLRVPVLDRAAGDEEEGGEAGEECFHDRGAMGLALHPGLLALGIGDQLAGHLGEVLTARNFLFAERSRKPGFGGMHG